MEYGAQPNAFENNQGSSRSSNNPTSRLPLYHFSIGSVESLEDKLTKAQHELGLDNKDFCPVTYQEETDWLLQGIKFIPTLALIGLVAFAVRGQAGKGGSAGGIFQIGKSNAKKINQQDINVNFSDVAGCQEGNYGVCRFPPRLLPLHQTWCQNSQGGTSVWTARNG